MSEVECMANELVSIELIGGFENALKAIKNGKRVRRSGWNGKECFVELREHVITNALDKLGDLAIHVPTINSPSAIASWVPSITDLMSEDWEIVEKKGGF
jgi:phage tail tape-measure protein